MMPDCLERAACRAGNQPIFLHLCQSLLVPCASAASSRAHQPTRPHQPTNCPLPQLEADGSLRVRAAQQQQMAAAVARVQGVLGEGRYLHIPYTTLFEYLKVRLRWQGMCWGGLQRPEVRSSVIRTG